MVYVVNIRLTRILYCVIVIDIYLRTLNIKRYNIIIIEYKYKLYLRYLNSKYGKEDTLQKIGRKTLL